VDPYYALFHVWTGQALPSALTVLALVLIASLFVERPWCRWFCPLGAVLGLIQLVSPWKIRRREGCTACSAAARRCALNVDVCGAKAVLDTRCNRCGECLTGCPVAGCLDHALPGRIGLSLKKRALTAALALTVFALPIAAAKIGGVFASPASAQPTLAVEGLTPDRISGELSLEELASGFDTNLDALKDFLELPAEISGSTRLRDIEDTVETLTTPLIRERMRSFTPS
jgi:ferredoxin